MKKGGKWLLSMVLIVSLAVPVSAAPVNLQDVSAVEATADTAADEQPAEMGVSSIEESAVGTEMTESAVGTETTESTDKRDRTRDKRNRTRDERDRTRDERDRTGDKRDRT